MVSSVIGHAKVCDLDIIFKIGPWAPFNYHLELAFLKDVEVILLERGLFDRILLKMSFLC